MCPKDSKKVNIFEISSLEVYDRGGGCPGSTLYIASLHVLVLEYGHGLNYLLL